MMRTTESIQFLDKTTGAPIGVPLRLCTFLAGAAQSGTTPVLVGARATTTAPPGCTNATGAAAIEPSTFWDPFIGRFIFTVQARLGTDGATAPAYPMIFVSPGDDPSEGIDPTTGAPTCDATTGHAHCWQAFRTSTALGSGDITVSARFNKFGVYQTWVQSNDPSFDGVIAPFHNHVLQWWPNAAAGQVGYASVASGQPGAGCATGGTLTITTGNGDATARIGAVDPVTGAVTYVVVTSVGSGYAFSSGVAVSQATSGGACTVQPQLDIYQAQATIGPQDAVYNYQSSPATILDLWGGAIDYDSNIPYALPWVIESECQGIAGSACQNAPADRQQHMTLGFITWSGCPAACATKFAISAQLDTSDTYYANGGAGPLNALQAPDGFHTAQLRATEGRRAYSFPQFGTHVYVHHSATVGGAVGTNATYWYDLDICNGQPAATCDTSAPKIVRHGVLGGGTSSGVVTMWPHNGGTGWTATGATITVGCGAQATVAAVKGGAVTWLKMQTANRGSACAQATDVAPTSCTGTCGSGLTVDTFLGGAYDAYNATAIATGDSAVGAPGAGVIYWGLTSSSATEFMDPAVAYLLPGGSVVQGPFPLNQGTQSNATWPSGCGGNSAGEPGNFDFINLESGAPNHVNWGPQFAWGGSPNSGMTACNWATEIIEFSLHVINSVSGGSITIPSAASATVGGSYAYNDGTTTPALTYGDGSNDFGASLDSTVSGQSYSFHSSNPSVATIDPATGLAQGVLAGQTNITLTIGGVVSNVSTLTVQ